uniref:YTH domain-containing family protein n=2 Tax=Rhizophora mucronata TaxID=61149 RepID=A0A2P2LNS7_RHIMU
MATVAPSSDQTAEMLQNLSLEPQAKTLEIPEPTKMTSVYQYGAVESAISTNGQMQSTERSVTPFLPDAYFVPNGMPSHAFYFGNYNGSGNEWNNYSRYANTDGVEMTPGVYGDNGSVMYHNSYGFAPYGPYSPAASPVPTVGNDGQLYGPQHYQYPPYFQPLTPTSEPFTPSQAASSQGELSATTTTDQKPLPVETAKGNSGGVVSGGVKGSNGSTPYKPMYQNSSVNLKNTYGNGTFPGSITASGYQDSRFGFDGQFRSAGINSAFPKGNNVPSSRSHNFRHNSNYMGLHPPGPISSMGSAHGFMNRLYPNKFYGQYGNSFRSGMSFGSGGYDSRVNTHNWFAVDGKYKPRGRGYGYFGLRNENVDGLNELNRGPRAKSFKNQKGFEPVSTVVSEQNVQLSQTVGEEKDEVSLISDREQYNKADFPEEYTDAKFFVIKSYSEDDVHKSIKYSVWASTPNGNKKLEAAYQEAQQNSARCPVFLFFSVNTSGQFVGLAEMVGPVDFHKNVEYWQQDKWTGCFSVKWHIVKDIPNNLLKHITLENNENKPVTNSRDTQEVKLEHGLKMIKIFKDHSSKTCILDDFEFYEKREKIIKEKKTKQQQYQKQLMERKPGNENKELGGANKTLDVSDVAKEPATIIQSNGDTKHLENGVVTKTGDALQSLTRPVVSENKVMANGIANGC